MNKYVRVMDGLKSNAGGFEYKLNEINVSDSWNPEAHSGKEFGGFNFTTENCIVSPTSKGLLSAVNLITIASPLFKYIFLFNVILNDKLSSIYSNY